MAFLFQKFQEGVKTLAKSSTFARDPRHLQFEADMNRLFLYTSYNRLGKDAEEADAEVIIDMATKAPFADQQKQIQENIHTQVKGFCTSMDGILLPNFDKKKEAHNLPLETTTAPSRSGLSLAIGRSEAPKNHIGVPETKPLSFAEVSQSLKDHLGYTLDLKKSQISHKEAGQGLFLSGEATVGAVVAFYPGVLYSPAYYRCIPGYPKVDARNSYLITRYDGVVINAQPWGTGGECREVWNGLGVYKTRSDMGEDTVKGSDRFWKLLSKPLKGGQGENGSEVLERRNPLALGHFANHPAKGMSPNVMVCPYDFPVTDTAMRAYIPNTSFGNEEQVKMKRFGSFWFKYGSSVNSDSNVPIVKTLVLVATRTLCDEEILLNYRLSNTKRRPAWYTPVDEEEDRRRWS
ncbi:uncharacterized protein LOC122646790 [Telopea speciosissima]|uniref:uncharacterized protein LOC122646790 n=1 Tax=Telopea speciosissima TaxID=54955 RepID=UPI001CC7801F|nr:uncharacterized protein LOC122646790 [Telopea speciosissima]